MKKEVKNSNRGEPFRLRAIIKCYKAESNRRDKGLNTIKLNKYKGDFLYKGQRD